MHGLPTCREHGSSAPLARAKRERVIEQERIEQRVTKLVGKAALPDESPADALRRIAGEASVLCAVLREHLTTKGVFDSRGQVSQPALVYRDSLEKTARVLSALVDRELASQERAGRIEAADAQLIVEAIKAAVHAPHVGLTPEQARTVLLELQRRLMGIEAA
jgi:hypothetical protein